MSTAGCPALGFLQPHCGGMVPWHCTAPSLVVPVVPGIRHCPPHLKHAAAPCLPSRWEGPHPCIGGWVPQLPQPRSSCHAWSLKDAPARQRLGRASSIFWRCNCPRGVCSSRGGGRRLSGSPSSTPVPWVASLDDFDSNLSLETKPALNSMGTHFSPAVPATEATCGSCTQGTPTERPRGGTLWVAPGEGLWRTWRPVPACRAGRAAFLVFLLCVISRRRSCQLLPALTQPDVGAA